MKKEEIEELRVAMECWADTGPAETAEAIWCGMDDVSAVSTVMAMRALPRLLAEREALLEAAQAMTDNEYDTDAHLPWASLRAAIALAES